MNASDIVKRKNNGTLYKAYNTTILRLSNPNTRPETFGDPSGNESYTCNDFINYELKNSVNEGQYVCGGKARSQLKFTTGPVVICPNVKFYQGTNYTNSDGSCLGCGTATCETC